jgi:hypothetical protein
VDIVVGHEQGNTLAGAKCKGKAVPCNHAREKPCVWVT